MPRSKFPNLLLSCAAGLLLLSLGWLAVVSAATAVGYLIVDRGGVSWATQGGSGAVLVGYGRIQPDAGSTTPAGLAIFGLRQNGILVGETGVPASPLTVSGRIYAEKSSSVNTGVAMANPNNQGALVNFFFSDINGNNFGAGSFTLAANGQRAAFLNEALFNGGEIINGTFTYSSSLPISAVAIRGLNNERGEFLLTTLPVVPLVAVVGETLLISHFADGGGWTTQIILVNPTDESISGTIQFLGQGSATTSAQPVVVSIGGQSNSTFSYTIPARSSRSLPTLGQGTVTRAGSVRITPLANQKTPAGLSVFSFRQAGIVVTEAGVPTLRATTAFRMYAESAQVGAIQTGVAVANNSSAPVAVNFELTTLSGASTGLTGTETIGGNGQVAKFLNQIEGFGSLAPPFQGILRISTASVAGVSVVGLRGRTNERGDFLITTTPPADETAPASNAELDFPHFVDNGGYTTQFILFSSTAPPAAAGIFGRFRATAPLNGTMRFFNQNGQPADLNLGTAPDLAISKSHTGSFTAGTNGVYTIQILNVGVGATSGAITVTDTLPAGMSFVSATGPGWNCSAAGATVTCVNAGPMAPAASSTIALTVAVSAGASGTLTNTVSVSNSSDSNPANNSSSDPTGVGTGADMSLTKSDSPDPAFVGADLTYTLVVRNNGPATATGVVVTDPLPPGVTFVSATPVLPATCSFSGGTVTCDFGSISNGDTKQVQIVVRPTAAGTLTNTATVTRNETDPVSTNNSSTATTTINAASANLSVSQTGPPTCSIGTNCDGVTYTVTVTNNGPGPASAVVLTDTLPIDPPSGAPVVTLVSATPGQGTCSGVSGGAFSCNLGTLNSGASTTVAVVVNVDATAIGRTITNAVSVSSAVADPNTANNASNFSHAVAPFPPETDLEVTTLSDSPDPVTLGSNLTYTATVINKGRSTATQVIVTDTLPGGVTFVSASSTQGSCIFSGGTVTCTLGTLLKNVSRTITIVVTPTTVGAKSNTVSISGNSGENDPVAGNNSLNVSTTVNGVPDLSITKSDSGAAFTVGVNGSYTITVTNSGTGATTGTITVNDTLPAGLSFVSGTGTNWTCSASGQAVTCTRATAIATSANSTITLTVNPTSAGSVTNTATVSTPGEVNTADNSGSDTTTINAAQGGLTIVLGRGVNESYRSAAVESLRFAQDAFRAIYNVVATDIFVSIYLDLEEMLDAYMTRLNLPESQRDFWRDIFRRFSGFTTFRAMWSGVWEGAILPTHGGWVHEYVHILQLELSENARGGRAPRWLEEGHAIHASFRAISPPPSAARWTSNLPPTSVRLDDIEDMRFFDIVNAGQLGALAVEYLRLQYGDGAMITFWRQLALSPWPVAFQSAFGVAPTSFYEAFERFRFDLMAPDLSIAKSDGGVAFTVGVNGSYTITVTNGGTGATTGTITVNDTLPAGLSFVSGTGTGWSCSAVGQAVTCSSATAIATGANSTITLTVNPTSPGSVTNTATVSTPGEVNTANNSGSDTTTINAAQINGRVIQSSGVGVPGVHVYACAVSAGGAPCGYGITDTDGRYSIVFSEPPGERRIQFGNTSNGCNPFGFLGPGGFTTNPAQAAIIQVVSSGPTNVPTITLPGEPSTLTPLNICQ